MIWSQILGERETKNNTIMTYTNKVTTLDITSNYGNSDRQHALRSTHKNWAFREDAEVKEPAMDRKRFSLELGATAPIAIADQCTNRLRNLKSHWNLHTSRIFHDVERNTWKWETFLAAVFEFVYAITALIFILLLLIFQPHGKYCNYANVTSKVFIFKSKTLENKKLFWML